MPIGGALGLGGGSVGESVSTGSMNGGGRGTFTCERDPALGTAVVPWPRCAATP